MIKCNAAELYFSDDTRHIKRNVYGCNCLDNCLKYYLPQLSNRYLLHFDYLPNRETQKLVNISDPQLATTAKQT